MGSKKKRLELEFIGAAGTVTGSCTRLTYGGKSYYIDCGLFQGPKSIRVKNWETVRNEKPIEAVFLTHAHIDHSGYLPKFAHDGFDGPIYCSSGTKDLAQVLLMDSAYLQVEDAKFLHKYKLSRHEPPKPLYTLRDAEKAISQLRALTPGEWKEIDDGLSVRLLRAGHILGSSLVQFSFEVGNGVKIVTFSGDLGNHRQFVIKGPEPLLESDYLILEGTYGDRKQPRINTLQVFEDIINRVTRRGGVLVIPAFAVGRTQEILYILNRLEEEGRTPKVPIYLDSPMATNSTSIYLNHKLELKPELMESKMEVPICPNDFQVVNSADESMLLCMRDGPMIVVSAAGMLTGGRVLHHLRRRLPEPNNAVLLVGYQAEETKGRLLQSGLPRIRIHKEIVDVEAEVIAIEGLSAHADSEELIEWVNQIDRKPKKIFLNHGELGPLRALQYRLVTELGLDVEIPQEGDVYVCD